jgi:cell shape-determining protein MreD
MRYLLLIFSWLLAVYVFTVLNYLDHGWQLLQPFLVVLLLIYFNSKNIIWSYSFALLAGIFLDSLNGIFGLQTIIFLFIVFVMRSLQLTILGTKNVFSTIVLILLALAMWWLIFGAINFIFHFNLYYFSQDLGRVIIKTFFIDVVLVILLHLLYYNFYVKKHERQSF